MVTPQTGRCSVFPQAGNWHGCPADSRKGNWISVCFLNMGKKGQPPRRGCPFFESRGGNWDSLSPTKGLPEHITIRQGGRELVAEGVVIVALGHHAGGVGELNHVAVSVVLVVALGAACDAPRQGQTPNVLLYRGAGDLQNQLHRVLVVKSLPFYTNTLLHYLYHRQGAW